MIQIHAATSWCLFLEMMGSSPGESRQLGVPHAFGNSCSLAGGRHWHCVHTLFMNKNPGMCVTVWAG